MTNQTVISIENVSKAYPIYSRPKDMLLELLTGKRRHNLFWALKDISFSVKEKQRLGIIGPNGSGKSTLLKIISGNLTPTSGHITINGKISAMLTLSTAINPEETGLNNIRFNLMMNGCPKSEIDELTEEIIDFAELGPFIYAPVKTYSTGMNARLSFTIVTAIQPEILVIDEVLGAGDAYFIGKATKRMIDLCERGKALVFVSHSTSAIQMLCDTAIWLDNGSIRKMGPVDYVVKLYEEDYRRREDEATRAGNMARKQQSVAGVSFLEMAGRDMCRMRIIPPDGASTFKDTHYIRRIMLAGEGSDTLEVGIAMSDINRSDVTACLDIPESEWGRLYSKDGSECRILCSQTGKIHGGQILVKKSGHRSDTWHLQLSFEVSSMLNQERLEVDFLNYKTARWERADILKRERLADGWEAITARMSIPEVDDQQYLTTLKTVERDNQPLVEVLNIEIVTREEIPHSVRERQPFEVRVHVRANRRVPVLDVGIKILRSDGVYVFWQSSGLDAGNLHDIKGEVTVKFTFDPNYFSHGQYSISAYCANGWDLKTNYPYSEVFDRKVNRCSFSVLPEIPVLDFGLINMRVPVSYVKNSRPY